MKIHKQGDFLKLIRKILLLILFVSIVGEMFFFPSWANFVGCIAVLLVSLVFKTFFLKREIFLKHTFSFLAFLSVFLARFIALPATLIEGKPITYGMEVPYETFFWDTLMFLTIGYAFHVAIKYQKPKNNTLQRLLLKLGFFSTTILTIWVLGAIGVIARIQNIASAGDLNYGDVGTKFLDGFMYLQYAPIVLLFPSLIGIDVDKKHKRWVWLFVVFMFIFSFATNSRQQMIYPIFTIVLLFFIYILKERISIFSFISPTRIVILGILLVFGLNLLSDISLVMLSTRNVRNDISRVELLERTMETLQDENLMKQLRTQSIEKMSAPSVYNAGWDETYLDNFMLNRYSNMRVVDQTLYYADKVGYGNEKMQQSFFFKTLALLPLPVLNFVGIQLDKEELTYSPGDILYATATGYYSSLGGFRVTSPIGDGLATFGYWCFPIAFLLFWGAFKLLDSLVVQVNGNYHYAIIGLINIFGFLGLFRFSIGLGTPAGYILRWFWQQCLMFWLVVTIVRLLPYGNNSKAK